MNRNPNMPIIIILCVFLFIYLFVNAVRHIKVYLVYSSGLGPFFVTGLIVLVIIILYIKRL